MIFLTPWRLKWYPRAILFALALGFFIALFTGHGASTLAGRLGADYPAFYSAGRMIAEGDWSSLYNTEKQYIAQRPLFPEKERKFLIYAYPPFVAITYSPLSLLEYRLSYAIHTMLMAGALLMAIWLFQPWNENIRRYYLLVACIAFSFYPMFRSILGGQNTALTLVLVTLCWRATLAGKEWMTGIILGFMLFKPQFALPLIGLYILSGRWRVGLGSLGVASILYAISAYISGPYWINSWFNFAGWLARLNASVNQENVVSWLGFFYAILGQKNQFASIIGWGLTFSTALGLAILWSRRKWHGNLTAQLGITMAALVLLSPHVMYYDVGLVLFPCMIMAGVPGKRSWILLGMVWVLGFSQLLSSLIGFSPLFFVSLSVLIASIHFLGQSAVRPASTV